MRAKRRYSRPGIFAAILLLLVGLVFVIFGVLPTNWIAQIQAYIVDAENALAALGDRSIPLGIGVLCLILGLITIRLAGTRKNAIKQSVASMSSDIDSGMVGVKENDAGPAEYWGSNWIAPISVYLDFENKPLAAGQIVPFVHLLRARIKALTGGERADLFFYADASNHATNPSYQALQQYGFRAVDVPHKRFDEVAAQRGDPNVTSGNLKNFVDFELSLHAYQRALVTRQSQWIILISEDTDFIPLIRRLRALGHRVQVWTRSAEREFTRLKSTLGIETVGWLDEIQPQLTRGANVASAGVQKGTTAKQAAKRSAPQKPADIVQANARQSNIKNSRISLPIRPLETSTGLALCEQTIDATLEAIKVAGNSLNAQIGSNLILLGFEDAKRYKGRNRIAFWLDELRALGILSHDSPGRMSVAPEPNVTATADLFYRFVQNDVREAVLAAPVTPEGAVSLTRVCQNIVARANSLDPEPIRKLRELFHEEANDYHLKHAQYLSQCARNFGWVTFSLLTGS